MQIKGVWIPLSNARELAHRFSVARYLDKLLVDDPTPYLPTYGSSHWPSLSLKSSTSTACTTAAVQESSDNSYPLPFAPIRESYRNRKEPEYLMRAPPMICAPSQPKKRLPSDYYADDDKFGMSDLSSRTDFMCTNHHSRLNRKPPSAPPSAYVETVVDVDVPILPPAKAAVIGDLPGTGRAGCAGMASQSSMSLSTMMN
eukprot:jgi/Hompol1/3046/HPOL_006310-RA